MRRSAAVFAFVLLAASSAGAQVRVGADSATRLTRFGRDAAYGVAEGLGFAAYAQWRGDPPQWPKTWTGYGQRSASNIGEFLIQEGVTSGLAAYMKRPLDYTHCRCRGTTDRIAWALHGAFTDQLPNGTHPLAVPRIAGAYAGSFAQAGWLPPNGTNRARVALLNGTESLAIGGLINLYHEFHNLR